MSSVYKPLERMNIKKFFPKNLKMSHFKAKLDVQLLRADQILETSAMPMELDMERTLSEINSTSLLAMDHSNESQEKSTSPETWTFPKVIFI